VKRLVLLAFLAGCPGLRHHSPQNAMGVSDLDTPFRGERGDPAAHEPPQDPGENQLGIAPGLFFGAGSGRTSDSTGAALAVGAQVHLAFGERDRTGHRGEIGFPFDAWGASLGWEIVQAHPDSPSIPSEMGPVYVEATRNYYFVSAGAGVAVYPTAGDVDVGGQVTLQAAVFALRMRYMEDTGFEIFGGYQAYLPASITWSR
jgi:hypothetical protein